MLFKIQGTGCYNINVIFILSPKDGLPEFAKFLHVYSFSCIWKKDGEVFGENTHCVKSVQIQSFFWSIFSCIRAEYGLTE